MKLPIDVSLIEIGRVYKGVQITVSKLSVLTIQDIINRDVAPSRSSFARFSYTFKKIHPCVQISTVTQITASLFLLVLPLLVARGAPFRTIVHLDPLVSLT